MHQSSPTPFAERLARATHAIARLSGEHIEARVTAATAMRATLPPLPGMLSVGDRLEVVGRDGAVVPAQVTASTAGETAITLFRDAAGLYRRRTAMAVTIRMATRRDHARWAACADE